MLDNVISLLVLFWPSSSSGKQTVFEDQDENEDDCGCAFPPCAQPQEGAGSRGPQHAALPVKDSSISA